jgi:hypothetical protein
MSNITTFNPTQAPAFAKRGELSDMAKALGGASSAGGAKRISIKGGVFRLMHGGKEIASIEDRHLEVILVKAAPKVSRIFYAKSYDGENITAPTCWSQDGETPNADVDTPQASRCSECTQNIAGSGQGNSRACRYQQRVAVVLANNPDGDVLQLALPPTSIFHKASEPIDQERMPLQAYARWLTANKINPEEVVTKLRFDMKSEAPKLFFQAVRWLSDDQYEAAQQQAQTPEALRAVTLTVAKMDNVPEAAPLALAGSRPKAKTAAAEIDEEVTEVVAKAKKTKAAVAEEVDEPEVRKEAKKPAVNAKASLAETVDQWDDE